MKFGFIGCGNMGGAIAKAVCKTTGPEQILLSNRTAEKAVRLAEELGCQVGTNFEAAQCEFVFLCVKPQMMRDMLEALIPVFQKRKDTFTLISMAAGLTIDQIRSMAGGNYPVIRMMPNTPSAIGEGMIQYSACDVKSETEEAFCHAMRFAGRLDKIGESLIDAASAVSGCGPAWAYMFVEALADGGVACGLPRQKAMEYAAQMLAGSAKMVLESGKHPGELKDAVCSPGGSTIQGVKTLEERGFRGAVMDAVISAAEKNQDMGRKG